MMRNCFTLVACVFLILTGSTVLAAKKDPQLLRIPYTSHADNAPREYFVYLPQNYHKQKNKQWPVMLFLHGNGERGNGLDELDFVLHHGPLYEAWIQKRDLPFIIISPQLHMFGMDEHAAYIRDRKSENIPKRLKKGVPDRPAPFDTEGPINGRPMHPDMASVDITLPVGWDKVEQDLLGMHERTHNDYRSDKKRTYLSGLSYGGFGTWWMASKHPSLFAAIIPVVGWGHPDLMAPIAEHKIPTWVFAAGRDQAVDIQYFYPGLNTLESLGHKVRFTNHEDMAHDAWTRVYQSQDLYDWMLSHSLD